MRHLILMFTAVFVFTGCKSTEQAPKYNTKINTKYKESVKTYVGQLNPAELSKLRQEVMQALKTDWPKDQAIMVHFYQEAYNCYEYGIAEESAKNMQRKVFQISQRWAIKNNALHFFVYTNEYLYPEQISASGRPREDTGFFKDNVFTLNENCRAVLIVKPNGAFYKHYGNDYFTDAMKEFWEKA
ncbi:MAG: hypothetical protein RQ756_06590 [Flavobacteriaceae bacterium]|nr:hypothetical protein [Flavobacteriaceae bacterium]